MKISFFVPGKPVPQGSMRAFAIRRKDGSVGAQVVSGVGSESTPLGGWRARIALAAQQAMDGRPLMAGAVSVTAIFVLPRPKALAKKKNAWPTNKRCGDDDKLLRALYDGLTGAAIVDDGQICVRSGGKYYELDPRSIGAAVGLVGVYVEVEEL